VLAACEGLENKSQDLLLRLQIRTEQCSVTSLTFEEHSIVFSWKRLHNYLSLQLPTTPTCLKKTIKKHTHILCAFSPFPTNIILPTCQPTLQATKRNCRVCIACFPQFPTTTTTNCHVLCLWWVECYTCEFAKPDYLHEHIHSSLDWCMSQLTC